MKIKDLGPIDFFPYLEVSKACLPNGQPILSWESLPIYTGFYEGTPEQPDILLVCSDVQGLVEEAGVYALMGEVLPSYIQLLLEDTFELQEDATIGVLLCGDLYTHPKKRGTSGDVRSVWAAFQTAFDWVVGVAGNHDHFGNVAEEKEFLASDAVLLHQTTTTINSLKIGGLGGIIGNPSKPQRTAEQDYWKGLQQLLKQSLDVLLLHESPDYPALNYIGQESIRKVLEESKHSTTVFCGHCHWEEPLVELSNGTAVVNVDGRLLILEKEKLKG